MALGLTTRLGDDLNHPSPVLLARNAMNTRFEIVVYHPDPIAARAAGEEALDEIERLEDQLSMYRPSSELSRLNARAADQSVRVEPQLFQLLDHARRLSEETGGAFDITIGPLMGCWGFLQATGHLPAPEAIAEARERVGMRFVQFDASGSAIRFAREGMRLDLGAIGKGYALDCAAEILRDAGIRQALIHGGTSTAYAIGRPPNAEAWQVAIDAPPNAAATSPDQQSQTAAPPLAVVSLRNEALSVSAVWGKAFVANDTVYGHVMDPRLGRPVLGACLAAVVLPSATETDALSTALLTLGAEGHNALWRLRPDMRTLLAMRDASPLGYRVESHGLH